MQSLQTALALLLRGAPDRMMAHRPVMLATSLAGLNLRPGSICVDATFGRGGHSGGILEQLNGSGFLHALDQDPQACQTAWTMYGALPNFRIHHRNFGELGALAAELDLVGRIDGILMDLGVSSPQLDEAERGFSFSKDGPLDMRMNPQAGEPASAWIARAKDEEIADVLFQYGEERASRRIARRIVEARAQEPILRTAQLADIIVRATTGPRQKIHPATRSFQAIRIFINRELDMLTQALQQASALLAPGGRLAVISFHSLEDRIVKRFMRDAGSSKTGEAPHLRKIGRFFPTDEESAENPRARSAVLRVVEKLP